MEIVKNRNNYTNLFDVYSILFSNISIFVDELYMLNK